MAAERIPVSDRADGPPVHIGYKLTQSRGQFLQAIPDESITGTSAFKEHEEAFDALGYMDEALPKIRERRDLSEFGKQERLEELAGISLTCVAIAAAKLQDERQRLHDLEAKELAPGQIDPADAAGAIVDMEVRGWFLSKKMPEQLQAAQDLSAAGLAALMRSPIKLDPRVAEMVAARWKEVKVAEKPALHDAIAKGRNAVEWVHRGLAQMASVGRVASGLSPQRLLFLLSNSSNAASKQGAWIFGFTTQEIEQMQHRIRADAQAGLRRVA